MRRIVSGLLGRVAGLDRYLRSPGSEILKNPLRFLAQVYWGNEDNFQLSLIENLN